MSAPSSSGTSSEVYTEATAQVNVQVKSQTYANALTATEMIAQYFGRDLRQMVNDAHVDLARWLEVPPGLVRDNEVLTQLIVDDLERMLRRKLISGVHLLLSDPTPDAFNHYKLRYHARYTIEDTVVARPDGSWNDTIHTLRESLGNHHFTFGITWNRGITHDQVNSVRVPRYHFNWLPEGKVYDGEGMVAYRFGGMKAGRTQVIRVELIPAQHLGAI